MFYSCLYPAAIIEFLCVLYLYPVSRKINPVYQHLKKLFEDTMHQTPNTGYDLDPINPAGTDGFEFVEYAEPNDSKLLESLFEQMGFSRFGLHKTKKIILYKQGDIYFILNQDPSSHAKKFANMHGPSCASIGFRVKDANKAYQRSIKLGAKAIATGTALLDNVTAIEGIGGSHLYLVDRYGKKGNVYESSFTKTTPSNIPDMGLAYIDHLTHNVYRGNMAKWADFYQRLFNFREIRYFDIEGKLTGLKSKAMTSPCGKIRIPINESADDKSQIEEYLKLYKGEGIQHIALATDNIYKTVESLRQRKIKFLAAPPATYYEMLQKRLPNHGEDVTRLQKNALLIDGSPTGGLLLQIFTETVIGPIFFEIIQRKGDEGFGEGNFRALFESMEQDQIRRGVLKA